MIIGDALSTAVAALSAVNTATLLAALWRGGRWTGIVDERLRALESSATWVMGMLKQRGKE